MSEESQFSEDTNIGWIQWFCGVEDHSFFCEVNQDFIKKQHNLFGLRAKVEKYNEALAMILRNAPPSEEEVEDTKFADLYPHATELYGLIHARYISTPEGLAIMRERFLAGRFGNCPRVMCEKQNVLPVAINQDVKIARVKIYCPRCKDIFSPKKKSSDTDGAYFGTTFPHLLMMTYPDLKPFFKRVQFVPRVFGFKITPQNNGEQENPLSKVNKPDSNQQEEFKLEEESVIKPEAPKKKNKKKR